MAVTQASGAFLTSAAGCLVASWGLRDSAAGAARGAEKRIAVAWIAALALGALPQAASAQTRDGPIATSDDCAGMSSKDAEIACLRRALQESERALRGGRVTNENSQVPRAEASPSVRSAASAPAHGSKSLGAEQVADRAERPKLRQTGQRISASVTGSSADHLGLLTLTLDNGQVWQQTEASGIPMRLRKSTRYPVEIRGSGFGGYRMSFTGRGRVLVVKRVR